MSIILSLKFIIQNKFNDERGAMCQALNTMHVVRYTIVFNKCTPWKFNEEYQVLWAMILKVSYKNYTQLYVIKQ